MKVLVIGSGGREHALAWKIASSPRVTHVYCAPGNAGTAEIAENVDIASSNNEALVQFARDNQVGLAVIGPDDALAAGLVDDFEAAGIVAFGPRAEAAKLESSKVFAKEFMRRHGIPTADSHEFDDCAAACDFCATASYPLVIKADGLALGKGVVIVQTADEAIEAVRSTMEGGQFGEAGRRIVVEEFLVGTECSIHAFVDGARWLLVPDCRDHKQVFDGGTGPNTGGMGTISPSYSLTDDLLAKVKSEVLDRFVAGIQADGIPFRGMLFPGLMITAAGLKVLEFNCRWGDPETQVLVRRLDSDLVDLLEATAMGRLNSVEPKWSRDAAVCVVLASGGYPGDYTKGLPITGLERAAGRPGVVVFHAGTRRTEKSLVTNGGRVLGVTATGPSLEGARSAAYAAADEIHFDKVHRRNDIGAL